MADLLVRLVENFAERASGPLHIRLVVQPLVAVVFAVIDGLKDARAGRPAYLWSMLTRPAERGALIRDGWRSVGKVFALALALDLAYQLVAQDTVRLGQALVVAFVLAIIPYVVLRGPVSRVAARGGRPR